MSITMANVRAALDPDEPDYEKARALGADALPFLAELIVGSDVLLAAKATYLAGEIGGEGTIPILEKAAGHADPSVRIASAAAARNLPPNLAEKIIPGLLKDMDPGIRRIAIQSSKIVLKKEGGLTLRPYLEHMIHNDPDPTIRALTRKLIEVP